MQEIQAEHKKQKKSRNISRNPGNEIIPTKIQVLVSEMAVSKFKLEKAYNHIIKKGRVCFKGGGKKKNHKI